MDGAWRRQAATVSLNGVVAAPRRRTGGSVRPAFPSHLLVVGIVMVVVLCCGIVGHCLLIWARACPGAGLVPGVGAGKLEQGEHGERRGPGRGGPWPRLMADAVASSSAEPVSSRLLVRLYAVRWIGARPRSSALSVRSWLCSSAGVSGKSAVCSAIPSRVRLCRNTANVSSADRVSLDSDTVPPSRW